MPTINIILPFYNRAWSLKRAIDSVLKQSFKNFQLTLINDGSTDNFLEIIEYALADKRVVLINQDNQGVSAARNIGVKSIETPFIAFLDSDDEWHKEKLKLQIEFFNNNLKCLINQTQEIWVRNGIRVNPPKRLLKKSGDLFEISLKDCMITPSSVMMTKELWSEINGFDINFPACEDYELWLRICSKYEIGLIDQNLLTRYGGHDDQLSSKYPQMDKFRVMAISKLLNNGNTLDPLKREQAIQVLEKKCRILTKGAKKHNNSEILELVNEIQVINNIKKIL